MHISYWEHDLYFHNLDVVIIGGGIVGLNAAWALKRAEPALKVLVLERSALPGGGSTKNAGFACFGSPTELIADLQLHPENEVFGLVERRWKGLKKLRNGLGDKAIEFHNWGGYELFQDEESYQQTLAALPYLNKQLRPIIGVEQTYQLADEKIQEFGFRKVDHLLVCVAEGQLHTGKLMHALSDKVREAGVQQLNGVSVMDLQEEGSGVTIQLENKQQLRSKKVLVCTDGFAKQLLPDLEVVPGRAQVVITDPIKNLKLKGTFHLEEGYYYFRNIGYRVLLGGGRNLDFETEKTTEAGFTELVQSRLENLLKEVILPETEFQIEQRWSGVMGLGPAKTTILQNVSPNISCAVRLAGMGVAIGTTVGEEAAELVLEQLS